jgi:NADH:ubiquinone oxidoreductase subunit E
VNKRALTLTAVLQAQQGAGGRRPNILRTLLAVQQALGYVSPDDIQTVAHTLAVTEAQVAGVLSYYPDLRRELPPRHVIRICMGESCVANHSGRLFKEVQARLGADIGETPPARHVQVEQVCCLGNCAVSPTVAIDDEVYGRVTVSYLDTVLDRYR